LLLVEDRESKMSSVDGCGAGGALDDRDYMVFNHNYIVEVQRVYSPLHSLRGTKKGSGPRLPLYEGVAKLGGVDESFLTCVGI